ncbi:hypothetical protein FD51_GL001264 [Lacticaseibacillus zeae DSM 20178 = KCTC 3804]|uniref:Sortase n=1 Tax=Lacticaseibacillus zeae DSM 20178 = KCTC 3804 TaxID=1423816 RepID=A0A0R1EP07_LACZE|nr:hypothetical protein FD51_GL001264 [Lacticaseibacillus zeae DSM 20178 = KCTC 3804]OLS06143.1 hypothetical protein AUQ39_11005 [Lacticaseibacillus casei]
MLRKSLLTFALVASGLVATSAVGYHIQHQDVAGSRITTREKVNAVSASSDLLNAKLAALPVEQTGTLAHGASGSGVTTSQTASPTQIKATPQYHVSVVKNAPVSSLKYFGLQVSNSAAGKTEAKTTAVKTTAVTTKASTTTAAATAKTAATTASVNKTAAVKQTTTSTAKKTTVVVDLLDATAAVQPAGQAIAHPQWSVVTSVAIKKTTQPTVASSTSAATKVTASSTVAVTTTKAATETQVSSAPAAPAKVTTSAPAASTTTAPATKAPAPAVKASTPTVTSSSTKVDLLNSTAASQPANQSVAHPSWSVASGTVASQQPAAQTAVKASTPAPAASNAPVASTPAPAAKPAAAPSTTQASAAAATPAPVQPAKPAPVVTPAQPVKPQVQPAPTYASRVLMFAGVTVPYIIGNESMDAAPANGAATWGGQANYSNNSGENTHFIGHNPGAFAAMLSLGIGSPITVTDAAGQARTYHVYRLATVNPNAVTADGQDLWDEITGTGGGQRITLQTCVGDYWRLIAFAR